MNLRVPPTHSERAATTVGKTFSLVILLLFCVLLYPTPLFNLEGQYRFFPAHLAWPVALLSLPIISRSRFYFGPITALMWFLRWLATVEFCIMTWNATGLQMIDLISFLGVLIPTFFYEIGYLTVLEGESRTTLKLLMIGIGLSALPVSAAATVILFRNGVVGLLDATGKLRSINASWPNYVSIISVIGLFIADEFSCGRKFQAWSALFLFVLALTLSRTGIAMLVVGSIVKFLLGLKSGNKSQMRNASRVVIVLVIVGTLVFLGKSAYPSSSIGSTITYRLGRWSAATQSIEKNPLVGVGLRSFTKAVPSYERPGMAFLFATNSAHNDFLDLLVRGGVLYLAAFGLLLLMCLSRSWKSVGRSSGPINIVTILLVVILVAALVQNPLKHNSIGPLFWLFVGMSASIVRLTDVKTDHKA